MMAGRRIDLAIARTAGPPASTSLFAAALGVVLMLRVDQPVLGVALNRSMVPCLSRSSADEVPTLCERRAPEVEVPRDEVRLTRHRRQTCYRMGMIEMGTIEFKWILSKLVVAGARGSIAALALTACDAGESSPVGTQTASGSGTSTTAAATNTSSTVTSGSTSTTGSSTSGGVSDCSKAGVWSTADDYGSVRMDPYVVRNNYWNHSAAGAGTQTVWAASANCWGVDSSHSDEAPKGTVKGYPDIQRGWGIGAAGYPIGTHGLGMMVSELTAARIRWWMRAPTSGRAWGLWDVYFHETPDPGSGVAAVNLMIQQRIVDSDRWMQNDSSAWPRVTIDGVTFRENLQTSTESSSRNRVRLYVDREDGFVLGTDDLELDLKAVIDYYVAQGSIRSTDYLTSIQAGWEIVSGGEFVTEEFWTAVQDEPIPN